jgi:hypothetical protein
MGGESAAGAGQRCRWDEEHSVLIPAFMNGGSEQIPATCASRCLPGIAASVPYADWTRLSSTADSRSFPCEREQHCAASWICTRNAGASGMPITSFRWRREVANVICPTCGRSASGVIRSTLQNSAFASKIDLRALESSRLCVTLRLQDSKTLAVSYILSSVGKECVWKTSM